MRQVFKNIGADIIGEIEEEPKAFLKEVIFLWQEKI